MNCGEEYGNPTRVTGSAAIRIERQGGGGRGRVMVGRCENVMAAQCGVGLISVRGRAGE